MRTGRPRRPLRPDAPATLPASRVPGAGTALGLGRADLAGLHPAHAPDPSRLGPGRAAPWRAAFPTGRTRPPGRPLPSGRAARCPRPRSRRPRRFHPFRTRGGEHVRPERRESAGSPRPRRRRGGSLARTPSAPPVTSPARARQATPRRRAPCRPLGSALCPARSQPPLHPCRGPLAVALASGRPSERRAPRLRAQHHQARGRWVPSGAPPRPPPASGQRAPREVSRRLPGTSRHRRPHRRGRRLP